MKLVQEKTRSSVVVALIADRTECSSTVRIDKNLIGYRPTAWFPFNAIHCDRSVSTCE